MSLSHIDSTWFREVNTAWNGYSVSLGIEEILYNEKSKYQDIMVFKR